MTIGSELRQAREQRGLTLAEISDRTKIRVSVLRAIERDDFKQLPGGVISRGFLRLVAHEVGLDATEISARFTAEFVAVEPGTAGDRNPNGRVLSVPGSDAGTAANRRAAVFGLAFLALVAVAYLTLKSVPAPAFVTDLAGRPEAAAGPVPVGTSSASGPEATAGAMGTTTPEAPPEAAAPEPDPVAEDPSPLRVGLHASAACRVSVTADGEQLAFRELTAGERLAIRATREVVLRIDAPANLTVSINERRMPPPARPDTALTLRITPANYRDLLKP